jgi:hypothetical protein
MVDIPFVFLLQKYYKKCLKNTKEKGITNFFEIQVLIINKLTILITNFCKGKGRPKIGRP